MADISSALQADLHRITKQSIQNLIQEIQMSEYIEEVEITIEPDQDPSTTTLADLMATYNQAKEAGSRDAAEITGGIKIASVDDIKEIAKEYTLKIQDLLDSDVEQTAVGKAVGKGLAVIDTKSSFLTKWFGSKKKALKEKDIEGMTIDALVKSLDVAVNAKRDEAIATTTKLQTIKENMIERLAIFEQIEKQVEQLLVKTKPATKEKFDAQRLAISVKGTIENIKNDIQTVYEPLVMMAVVAVENIQNNLPTVADDLQRILAAKAGQKNIKQLNDIYTAYSEMGKEARNKIKLAVNQTMLDTISLVGNTGIDVAQIEKATKADLEQQKKIQQKIAETVNKIEQDYKEMARIQDTLIEGRKHVNSTMISQYSITGPR